ncbi:ECF transporter S component [Liquorilactobacillus uvarum]|uniref:ECF transporter S component n=1 Tax=Liquorilactobacillus uvarum TaxID=303240 RepID=UPI00288AC31F|nr:ECF transporter S component [Liquorilactobacillus uvarum]
MKQKSNSKSSLKRLTLVAVLIAVNIVVARVFLIPIPMTHGYINLCDAGIFIAALLFGKREGAIVGGLSGFLLDLIAGYPQYMLFSLVIHGLEGYLAGMLLSTTTKGKSAFLLASFVGIIVMVGGYFAADSLLYTVQTGLVGVPTNLFQGIVGALVALPVYYRLSSGVTSSNKQ